METMKPKAGEACFTCGCSEKNLVTFAVPITDGRHAWLFLCRECGAECCCRSARGEASETIIRALCTRSWTWTEDRRVVFQHELN